MICLVKVNNKYYYKSYVTLWNEHDETIKLEVNLSLIQVALVAKVT